MKKDRTIDYIAIIITSLFMLAVMTFTLGSLESAGDAWFVKPRFNKETGNYVGESVILQCADNAEAINKVYVRIGNVYNADKDGKIKFTIDVSSSMKELCKQGTYFAPNRYEFFIESRGDKTFAPGWYSLSEELFISYNFIRITTEQSFDFEEVVFFDKNNKQIEAECLGGFESGKFIDSGELTEVAAVCDGQKSFAFDSKHILGNNEESLLGFAKNLYSYEGYYISEKVMPFGALICGLGVQFFGNSPFALRFMPFLFSLATLILVYFFAKKLFNNALYGIFAEVVWLLCGIGLALCGTGYSTSIALFFVVLAYYNAYIFYTDKSVSHSFEKYKSMYIGGALIAIAGTIDIFALTALPCLILFYLIASVKGIRLTNKAYKLATGLQKEYMREQYIKTLSYSICGNVLSLLIMPFLLLLISYGIFSPIYTYYYGVDSIFMAMLSNLSAIVEANNGSFALGWLIGLSSESVAGIEPRIISANKALVVFCFMSTLIFLALFILNSNKKLLNPELADAISADYQIRFIVLAFVLTFATNLLGGFFADYSTFAYSLIFLSLVLPCSYNLYCKNINRMVFNLSFSFVFALSVVFFLLSAVCFLGIDIPENVARYLYGWTL